MRGALLAVVLLVACIAPGHRVQADANVFTSDDYGFKIDRPEGWTFSEPTPPAGALYGAKLAKVKDSTETSVTVYVVARADVVKDSKQARDAAEANWKQSKEISNITRGKGKLLDEEVHWLRATYDAGAKYTLRQHFLVHEEYVFILQSLAPEKEFETADKDLSKLLDTFDFVTVDPDAARLRRIASFCGREINWAESWQSASERAKTENRLILVVFEVYRGLDVPVFTPSTLFMHRDILELVNERFVPMFWQVDTRAPFDDPRVFGLGGSTFGQGIMFATPEGKIVGQCSTFDIPHVYERCREMLAEHPGAPAKNANDAAELLRRGDLDAAAGLLKTPTTGVQWRLKGQLLRKQRDGEAALKAFDEAGKLGETNLEADRGLVLLGMGEYARADKLLAKSDAPEAIFWHCMARANLKGFDAVLETMKALALDNPETHWGRWAAALIVEPKIRELPARFIWPGPAQFRSWRMPAYENKTDAKAAREDAIRFLLENQAADGHWVNPRSTGSGIFDIAITAICAQSLLPYVDRELVKEAVSKALDFIAKKELRAVNEALFDYTIWAQIFAIDFMASCIESKIGDNARSLKAINAIVKDMELHQYPGGGWGYFRSPAAPDNTIGFVTSAAILSLQRADKAGAKVPARMLSRACESIRKLKSDTGAYGYMWASGAVVPEREAESSLRSPLYALALKRGGLIEPAEVRKSLDVYLKHHDHTIAERGKCICHTGPEGTAAYYLLFGYRYAAEALAELPEKDRAPYAKALQDDVLKMRLGDGSFCDFPAVGREYGAGMALTALHLLEQK